VTYANGFRVRLIERGYKSLTVDGQLRLMHHVSRWLAVPPSADIIPRALVTRRDDRYREGPRCVIRDVTYAYSR